MGHPSNWLSIMGSNLWSPCPKCVTGENLIAATLEICMFSYCDEFLLPSPLMIDAQLFSSQIVCDWSCKLRHAKVSAGKLTWKVCSECSFEFLIMTYIVTKGAPVQSCRDLTNHKSSQGVGWPTTSTGRVRLHFPSPNEQTGAAMGGNGNLLLTGHLRVY